MKLKERISTALLLEGPSRYFMLLLTINAIGWSLYVPFWVKHMQNQGASTTSIGAMFSVYNLFMILQIVSGQISDNIGRKKAMVLAYTLNTVGIVSVLFAQNWTWIVIPIVLWGIGDSLIMPISGVYFAEVSGKDEGTAFSLRNLTRFIPGFFAPTLAAIIIERYGFSSLTWIVICTQIISFAILILYVPETLDQTKPLNLSDITRKILRTIRPKGGLTTFYVLALLDTVMFGLFAPFLVIIFTDYYGFTVLQSGLLLNVVTMSTAIFLLPMGKLIDRFSSGRMLKLYAAMFVVNSLLYLFVRDFRVLLFAQFVRGVSLSIWNPAYGAYLYSSVSSDERGTYFGNLNALRSLASLPAPILGTFLLDRFGVNGVFLCVVFGAVLMFITSLGLKRTNTGVISEQSKSPV